MTTKGILLTALLWAMSPATGLAQDAKSTEASSKGSASANVGAVPDLARDILKATQNRPKGSFSVPERLKQSGVLKEGDNNPDVATLRRGLEHWGYQAGFGELYDGALAETVKSFQKDFDLDQDGAAGPQVWNQIGSSSKGSDTAALWATRLTETAKKEAQRGNNLIVVVNIASFTLYAIDTKTGKTLLESRVIVGKPRTKTPRWAMKIVDLKYNPGWNPPKSIGGRYVPPGNNNPLGQIRFSTVNGGAIFLHDTNQRGLFAQQQRAFSHGCVRVQQWAELGAVLSGQTKEQVEAKTEGNTTKIENIRDVPLYLTYATADVKNGKIRNYPDIYGLGRVDWPGATRSQVSKKEAEDAAP